MVKAERLRREGGSEYAIFYSVYTRSMYLNLSSINNPLHCVSDPLLSVESFAQVLCEDLELLASSLAPAIVQSIKQVH